MFDQTPSSRNVCCGPKGPAEGTSEYALRRPYNSAFVEGVAWLQLMLGIVCGFLC